MPRPIRSHPAAHRRPATPSRVSPDRPPASPGPYAPPRISYLGGSRDFDEMTGQYRNRIDRPASRMSPLQSARPVGPAAPPVAPRQGGEPPVRPIDRMMADLTAVRSRVGRATPSRTPYPAPTRQDNVYASPYAGTVYEDVDKSVRGGMWDRFMELLAALMGGGK